MTDHSPPSSRGDADIYHQSISVPFDYPVVFTRGLFDPHSDLLVSILDRLAEGRRHRALVTVDDGLLAARPDLHNRIRETFLAYPEQMELTGITPVPGGERAKNGWETVRDVMWTIGEMHLDRQSFVIAVGGGAMLDMVGFAASIVHRGLRLVRVPTTTLAQGDGGVGVKNGMDEHGRKNFVGTFAPPFAVLNDFDFLRSLDQTHWIGGVAEAFKVAIIKDAAFFEFLCGNAGALADRDEAAMEQVVRRTAILHLEHIRTAGDPFEFGSARPLDFGHWIGHRLETMSDYALAHGQAAAVGIAVDATVAGYDGLLTADELESILAGLAACGLPFWDDLLARRSADGMLDILDGLEQFREHLGGQLTITLPDGIGNKVDVHRMDPGQIEQAVGDLQRRAGA